MPAYPWLCPLAATPAREAVRPGPPPAMDPAHDPVLRRRTEAVELLGRFDDPKAVAVLDDLLLRGRRHWAAPTGQWLHDTALLTLLQSPRLPRKDVDRTLRRAYSFLRHPYRGSGARSMTIYPVARYVSWASFSGRFGCGRC